MSGLPPEEIAYQEAHIRENKGPILIGTCVMLLALSTTTVILRIISRRIKRVKLAADDYLIFLAQVSCTLNISAPTANYSDHFLGSACRFDGGNLC